MTSTGTANLHQSFHDVDSTRDAAAIEAYLENNFVARIWTESRERRLAMTGFRKGEHVLDAGCGVGMAAAVLSKAAPDIQYTGLDFSDDLLARARLRAQSAGLSAVFHQGDIQRLPFADNSFDVVWLERVLLYVERPELAFAEFRRVLRPQGRLAIGEVDISTIWMTAPPGTISDQIVMGATRNMRNPDIARRVWSLCREAGFNAVDGGPTLFVGRDYTFSYRAGNHARWLEELVQSGRVSQTEADNWIREMWSLNETGAYRSATPIFDFVAVKS